METDDHEMKYNFMNNILAIKTEYLVIYNIGLA